MHTHHLSARTACPLAAARQTLIDSGCVEAPVAGPDGLIWSAPRWHMISPAAIRVRLAEDIIGVWRETDGHLSIGDLTRIGWPRDAASEHALAPHIQQQLAVAIALARRARPDLIGEAVRTIRRAA